MPMCTLFRKTVEQLCTMPLHMDKLENYILHTVPLVVVLKIQCEIAYSVFRGDFIVASSTGMLISVFFFYIFPLCISKWHIRHDYQVSK